MRQLGLTIFCGVLLVLGAISSAEEPVSPSRGHGPISSSITLTTRLAILVIVADGQKLPLSEIKSRDESLRALFQKGDADRDGILTWEEVQALIAEEKAEAIKYDLKQLEGTWRLALHEQDGFEVLDENATQKITVVISADGSWRLCDEEKEVNHLTSTIDPKKRPKTIDFTQTVGLKKGDQPLGIYEVSEESLRVCVAPSGNERPSRFSTKLGSPNVILTFERVKAK